MCLVVFFPRHTRDWISSLVDVCSLCNEKWIACVGTVRFAAVLGSRENDCYAFSMLWTVSPIEQCMLSAEPISKRVVICAFVSILNRVLIMVLISVSSDTECRASSSLWAVIYLNVMK